MVTRWSRLPSHAFSCSFLALTRSRASFSFSSRRSVSSFNCGAGKAVGVEKRGGLYGADVLGGGR